MGVSGNLLALAVYHSEGIRVHEQTHGQAFLGATTEHLLKPCFLELRCRYLVWIKPETFNSPFSESAHFNVTGFIGSINHRYSSENIWTRLIVSSM